MSFAQRVRRAMNLLSYGSSVGQVAQVIAPECGGVERAHLTARAAEVYMAMIRRDVAVERRERLARRGVRWL